MVLVPIRRPVNSVSQGLTTAAEDRERPQPLVASEYLLPIFLITDVVEALIGLSLHLKVLNRGLVRQGELNVELEEHSHQDRNDAIEHVGDLNHNVLYQLLLVSLLCAEVVCIEGPLDALEPGERHRNGHEVGHNEHVNEEQDEKFAVPKPNAIVDPGTVMVHVEDAAVAGGAVMAPLRLEDVAHEAVASSLVLRVTQVKAPEDWHLARICRHGLNEGPDEHEE